MKNNIRIKEGIDFSAIEKKWQKKWDDARVFEVNENSKKKFFINFPYPYINAHLHLGHAFSSARVDAAARYKRMQGFNVLFPQAWHCTGTPVWAAAQRIKEKEPKQIQIMKAQGFSDQEIESFSEIKHWIDVFVPAAQEDFRRFGVSVDWRRTFITTDLNPYYDKFIKWQFRKLKEKGYVKKSRHPVVWCEKDNIVVGDHDRAEGEGFTTQDFIWIKFKLKDSDLILMAGTTRPDALYGQTNLWIDPNGDYVVVQVKDERWVVGKEVVYKIRNQYDENVKIISSISPKELTGKWVTGPIIGHQIHILPAWFIKSSVGSGIVYSALEDPVDLFELKKIQSDEKFIKEYNLDEKEVKKLKPIDIIRVEGLGDNLGESIGKEFGVKSSDDVELLEKAKGELNKRVFRKGIMRENCGECAGMTVQQAQTFLKKKLVMNDAVMFYELEGKVVCRCLTPSVIKIVSDQWFLKYGNESWKKEVHAALDRLKLYPEQVRQQFNYVIDWLNDWACAHHQGAGTRLPWDNKWVIESLSDSTIYMAYYTIAHLIKKYSLEKIDDSFFDFIFLGVGKGDKKMQEMKKEFEYWYPFDVRSSGKDLVQNHLSFCLFNHVAIFPEKYWPKGFSVNGWLLIEGDKMSKSKGNFFTIRQVLEKYPVDALRAGLLLGGEGLDDPNFGFTNVEIVRQKLFQWYEFVKTNYKKTSKKRTENRSDRIFLSSLNRFLREGGESMDNMMFRTAFDKLFFQLQRVFREYINRGEINQKIINDFILIQNKVLSPFCPYIAEELWSKLGGKGFISLAEWPEADESKIDLKLEESEKAVDKTVSDVMNVLKIIKEKQGKDGDKVYLYVIPNEIGNYNSSLLSKRVGKEVEVFAVNDKKKYDPENKSAKAKPGKPGIYVE